MKPNNRGTFIVFVTILCALLAKPAFAQIDFSGEWAPLYHEDSPERLPGPELGDYLELPLNDVARMRADSYDADRISVVQEYQCRPHGADYAMRGLGNIRVWREIDQASQRLIAFHLHFLAWDSERTIWMDGRPHPNELAPHTWQGFSTGVWEGNMLTITTTHLKENYIRRNGVPRSDKATFTEHWARHGDWLTVITSQTRLLHFEGKPPESGAPSWQGYSVANWEKPPRGPGTPAPGLGAVRQGLQGHALEVVTTQLRSGYLRKNGPPYSANAVVREFYDSFTERNGDTWFVVTTVVEDPTYLAEPFVTSSNFKKQASGAGFSPTPCSAR